MKSAIRSAYLTKEQQGLVSEMEISVSKGFRLYNEFIENSSGIINIDCSASFRSAARSMVKLAEISSRRPTYQQALTASSKLNRIANRIDTTHTKKWMALKRHEESDKGLLGMGLSGSESAALGIAIVGFPLPPL